MKKYICIFLFVTMIMMSGCIQDKSPGMQNAGYPLEIDKDNSITVKDSYIEDNHLIIELQANLSSYNPFFLIKKCINYNKNAMRENIKEWLEYILDEKMELDENKFTIDSLIMNKSSHLGKKMPT